MQLHDGRSFTGDELLIAVGRHIDSDKLGLDTIGLQPGRHGYLPVDEHLRVPGHDWLWVVGDANGRALLTHMAKHQARVPPTGSAASPTPRSGTVATAPARRG